MSSNRKKTELIGCQECSEKKICFKCDFKNNSRDGFEKLVFCDMCIGGYKYNGILYSRAVKKCVDCHKPICDFCARKCCNPRCKFFNRKKHVYFCPDCSYKCSKCFYTSLCKNCGEYKKCQSCDHHYCSKCENHLCYRACSCCEKLICCTYCTNCKHCHQVTCIDCLITKDPPSSYEDPFEQNKYCLDCLKCVICEKSETDWCNECYLSFCSEHLDEKAHDCDNY